jgi:hypothetical protein
MTGLTGASYPPGVADQRGANLGFDVREGSITRTVSTGPTR